MRLFVPPSRKNEVWVETLKQSNKWNRSTWSQLLMLCIIGATYIGVFHVLTYSIGPRGVIYSSIEVVAHLAAGLLGLDLGVRNCLVMGCMAYTTYAFASIFTVRGSIPAQTVVLDAIQGFGAAFLWTALNTAIAVYALPHERGHMHPRFIAAVQIGIICGLGLSMLIEFGNFVWTAESAIQCYSLVLLIITLVCLIQAIVIIRNPHKVERVDGSYSRYVRLGVPKARLKVYFGVICDIGWEVTCLLPFCFVVGCHRENTNPRLHVSVIQAERYKYWCSITLGSVYKVPTGILFGRIFGKKGTSAVTKAAAGIAIITVETVIISFVTLSVTNVTNCLYSTYWRKYEELVKRRSWGGW